MRDTLATAEDYDRKIKIYGSDGLHMPDRNLWSEALLLVVRVDLPLKINVHRSDDIATDICIAEKFNIRVTLDQCTEGYKLTDLLISALNKKCEGIIISPLMIFKRKLECSNILGVSLPKRLYNAGIEFAICTDFPEMIPRR